jgi:uncharacterized protein (TIGR03067 family)
MRASSFWISELIVLSGAALGAAQGDITVPGPEDATLVKQLKGYFVQSNRVTIEAVSLPDLGRGIVLPPRVADADDVATVHALSGPDRDGWIAYIEGHEKRHHLKIVQLDGSRDTIIFTRLGNASWASAIENGEIGEHIALAPCGGRVAILTQPRDKQMPWCLFSQGTIEIWDINKKEKLNVIKATALDASMSWFPDGKQLAYVAMVPVKKPPKTGVTITDLMNGDYTRGWDALPAIHVLDVESGRTRCLSLGWVPVVGFDGKSFLIGSSVSELDASGVTKYTLTGCPSVDEIWHRLDINTGKATRVTWPGGGSGAIAQPAGNLVLYMGCPTAGQRVKHSPYGSFKAGIQLQTIKVAVMDSTRFQTVVPDVDLRHLKLMSFGSCSKRMNFVDHVVLEKAPHLSAAQQRAAAAEAARLHKAKAAPAEALRGTWEVRSATFDGADQTAELKKLDFRLIIKDTLTIGPADLRLTSPIAIDSTARPGTFDWLMSLGIYELTDKELKICMGGATRPTDFTSTAGSARMLLILTRIKGK